MIEQSITYVSNLKSGTRIYVKYLGMGVNKSVSRFCDKNGKVMSIIKRKSEYVSEGDCVVIEKGITGYHYVYNVTKNVYIPND